VLLRQYSTIEEISSVWETSAMGTQGPNFLNLVIMICCHLPPDEFKMQVIRSIENQLGRVRSQDKNSPRTIDIDILIADGQILDKQIWERAHLAIPLSEIIQDISNPDSGLGIGFIANQLSKVQLIKPRDDITKLINKV
jgi:2-amino-4-hydroxy-6-hydroxymethyldihydropteridine diphosphokinase